MNAWIDGKTGELISQINPLITANPPVVPSQGFYSRLEILRGISERILLHEEAATEKNRLVVSIASGAIVEPSSLDNANAKITQLTQYMSYLETYVLLDFIKYPTILIE
jgi:tellurite resistance-related uncharacterized protein